MGRAELLARMDSRELSGWWVFLQVQRDEQAKAAESARLRAESDDGEIIELNRPADDDDDEDDEGGEDDGSTE